MDKIIKPIEYSRNPYKRIGLIFFRADTKAPWYKKLYRKAIAWWTKGPYSHVELIWYDDDKNELRTFSAVPTVRKVREANGEDVLKEGEWDAITFDITEDEWYTFVKYKNLLLGERYDWLGIFGFILPFKDRTKEWFCSEITSNYLKIIGAESFWFLEPSKISPNKLYSLALKMCYRDIKYGKANEVIKLLKKDIENGKSK